MPVYQLTCASWSSSALRVEKLTDEGLIICRVVPSMRAPGPAETVSSSRYACWAPDGGEYSSCTSEDLLDSPASTTLRDMTDVPSPGRHETTCTGSSSCAPRGTRTKTPALNAALLSAVNLSSAWSADSRAALT